MSEKKLNVVEDSLEEEFKYEGIAPAEDPEDPDRRKVQTAFLVILEENGTVVCTNDVDPNIELDRVANLNDMFIGCSVTIKDLTALETSQRTAQVMMELSQQIAQATQKPKSGLVTPTGMRVPR